MTPLQRLLRRASPMISAALVCLVALEVRFLEIGFLTPYGVTPS